jgi:HlyD family secretion protein
LRGSTVALIALGLACGEAPDNLRLVGSVERTAVELVAPIAEVVAALPVGRGGAVAPGDVVVRLDSTLARAELAAAEAALAGARTADRVAEHELERLRGLRRRRVASEQDLDRAELQRDEATARLREAAAHLDAARKRVDDLVLRAPSEGVVDQLPYEVGERVPAGAVVAVILEQSDPWVRVWVPETAAARVRPGTRAEIAVDGLEAPLAGRVLDVSREPAFTPHYALTERDRVHLVYETRVEIEGAPAGLRPGVGATVRLFPDAGGPPP